jgi:cardiolipin synthase A/B
MFELVLANKNLFITLLSLFSIFSACHAILHKRDSRAGFGWLVTCLMFIGVGPCLYWLFGINRIRTHAQKIYRLGSLKNETRAEKEDWSRYLPREDHPIFKDYKGILNVSERVNRHPLMVHNRIEPLFNGEEAYPAMIQAIDEAQKSICLSTYIFDWDETGLRFSKSLVDAKKRGVKIWVLVDAFGERYSHPRISRLLGAQSIPFARFLPLSFSVNSLHLNLRNHRKLLIVDGQTAFTGGMNIRGRHFSNDKNQKEAITDIHFKIEGPVLLELQEVFFEDWYFTTREPLPWGAHNHENPAGSSLCRAISGGPNEDFEKINWILFGALAWSQKRIQIMTPYFVPDPSMITALNTAALRGVTVEVVLPEVNNLLFVHWATRALLGEMLPNGIKVYYQPAPFSHSKLFIVDESYTLIGSSNWDARSFRLNFELDLEVYDPAFSKSLAGHFDDVVSRSREVTLDELKKDPLPIRFRNSFFKLFSPYL